MDKVIWAGEGGDNRVCCLKMSPSATFLTELMLFLKCYLSFYSTKNTEFAVLKMSPSAKINSLKSYLSFYSTKNMSLNHILKTSFLSFQHFGTSRFL